MKTKDLVVGQEYHHDASRQWDLYSSGAEKVIVLDTTGWTKRTSYRVYTRESTETETQSGVVKVPYHIKHGGNGVLVRVSPRLGWLSSRIDVVQPASIRDTWDAPQAHIAEVKERDEKNRRESEQRRVDQRERRSQIERALETFNVKNIGYQDDRISLSLDDAAHLLDLLDGK